MNNETIIEFSFISMPDSEAEIRGGGEEGGGHSEPFVPLLVFGVPGKDSA